MKSLEDIFVGEFKKAVSNPRKFLSEIPLPESVKQWTTIPTEMYAVKGISLECYSLLNKTIVKGIPKGKTAKRRVIDKVTRTFKLNDDGSFVYEDYKVPTGSIVVTSTKSINLPYSEYNNSKDGYGYIDFIKVEDEVLYMYVLPKSVLYRVNQTALAISYAGNLKCYNGMGYQSWKNGIVYLKIIPYKPNATYRETKILKTGYGLDYMSECQEIVDYWSSINFMPRAVDCELEDGRNLAIVECEADNEYYPFAQLSLGDKDIYGSEESKQDPYL